MKQEKKCVKKSKFYENDSNLFAFLKHGCHLNMCKKNFLPVNLIKIHAKRHQKIHFILIYIIHIKMMMIYIHTLIAHGVKKSKNLALFWHGASPKAQNWWNFEWSRSCVWLEVDFELWLVLIVDVQQFWRHVLSGIYT